MTLRKFDLVAARCITRAKHTCGRLAVLLMADESCRILMLADAELLIKTGQASWRNVAGVYSAESHSEEIVADILAVRL